MSEKILTKPLEAHRVTKPIQLLAAWLIGLIAIDSAFLAAAKVISEPSWVSGLLVIAAVINVPLFLLCIFILQTKFRPEMQEDTFYAQYLETRQVTQTREDPINEIQLIRKQLLDSNSRVLELVENFQDQITSFAEVISNSANNEETDVGSLSMRLEEKIEQGKANFQLALRNVEKARALVSINDLLPSYSDMRKRLEQFGIEIAGTFGSSSVPAERPGRFIVAIGDGVPVELMREVLDQVAGFGVEGVDYAYESSSRGKIYIGAYGYEESPYLKLGAASVRKFMNPNLTQEQFQNLLSSKGLEGLES